MSGNSSFLKPHVNQMLCYCNAGEPAVHVDQLLERVSKILEEDSKRAMDTQLNKLKAELESKYVE